MKNSTFRNYFVGALMLVLVFGVAQATYAVDAIPYGPPGYNNTTYSFIAANTGNIVAYFESKSADYVTEIGLLVNGNPTGIFGLNNQTSIQGNFLNLGPVNQNDTLVFVLRNVSPLGLDVFSDPALNGSFDLSGTDHNHIYSTPYTGDPLRDAIPNGTYVGFEDLQFPNSDFDYNDENFIFTNVATNKVPEPSSILLLGAGLLGAGLLRRKIRLS